MTSRHNLNELTRGAQLAGFGDVIYELGVVLTELKTDFVAHTHTDTTTVPTDLVATITVVQSLTAEGITELDNECVAYGFASLGTAADSLRTLTNELVSDYNAHVHTGGGDAAWDQTVAAAAVTALTTVEQAWIDKLWPINIHQAEFGTYMAQIISLANEMLTDIATHQHPTALATITDVVIGTADIAPIG